MTSDFVAYLFQSREVSCLEVHVNETKMKSPSTSEIFDLNCLPLLFVPWEMQLKLDKCLICFSLCVVSAWGLRSVNYILVNSENSLEVA